MRAYRLSSPSRSSRRGGTSLVLAAIVLLMAACSTPLAPPPVTPDAQTYRVGPPDQLFISILPDPVIERTAVVRPDGMISIDLIGDVQASGRTTEQIAEEIEQRVSRFKRDAKTTVSVASSQSIAITVFGEVRDPGTFPLTSDTRVSEAIGLRGGTTIFGSKRKIRVVRTNGETTRAFTIDLASIQQGDLSSNIMLRGGDMIVVPPNILARIGYGLQVLLFPFQQILSAGTGLFTAAAIF
ncbi:MAG: polysaccharide export protein [Myxococcota bacterium]|nr:polysaccharide export protein [Myxococcota bacterium]